MIYDGVTMNTNEFNALKELAVEIVEQFEVGHTKTQVGTMGFSTGLGHKFHLSDYSIKKDIINHLQSLPLNGASDSLVGLHSVLSGMRDIQFSPANGARTGKYIINSAKMVKVYGVP